MVAYVDDFNRADGVLVSPWSNAPVGSIRIVSNQLAVYTTSTQAAAANATQLASSDQYVRVTPKNLVGTWMLALRSNADFSTYYGFRRATATTVTFEKVVDGTRTTLGSAVAGTVTVDQVMEFQVQGTTLRGYLNGVKVHEYVDTANSIPTGLGAGFRVTGNAQGNTVDDFGAGDLSAPVVDTTKPSNVTGVAASNITATTATITYNAATDNVAVVNYLTAVKVTSTGTAISGSPFSSATLSRALSGLTASTGYTAEVRAQDAAGNISDVAGTATFSTIAGGVTPEPSANSDNFNRVDGSLGTPWTVVPSNAIQVVSNQAQILSTSSTIVAAFGVAVGSDDHMVRANFYGAGDVALIARSNDTITTYYALRRIATALSFIKVIGSGSFSTIGTPVAYTLNDGDLVEFRVVGSTLYGMVNGSVVLTETDTSITTGVATGFRNTAAAQGFAFDNWEMGVGVAPTAPGDTTGPSTSTLTASNVTANSATLTSSVATDASGINGYQLFKGTTAVGSRQTSRVWNLTGLTASTPYTDYNVIAYDNSTAQNPSARGYANFTTTAASSSGATMNYFDGNNEIVLTRTTLRFFDGQKEIGFDYGKREPSWFTGTNEIALNNLPSTGKPSINRWKGLTTLAIGDSSGNVQGTAGTDFDATQTWPKLMGAGWSGAPSDYPTGLATTVTNLHRNSFTMQDVALNLLSASSALYWTPGSYKLVTVFAGGNDVGILHNTTRGREGYKHAIRSIIAILRSASRVTSGFTEVGTWAANSSTYSGNARVTTAANSSITIPFTGSNATAMLLSKTDGTGATFTYQIDGGAVQNGTTVNQSGVPLLGAAFAPMPIVMSGLGSGAHTIKITNVSGTLIVDSVIVESTSQTNMPFALFFPPGLFSDEGAAGYPNPDPTNTDVAEFRVMFDDVFREYPNATNLGRVLADRGDVLFPPTNLSIRIADGLHPNLAGNKVIASIALESLRNYAPIL